MIFLIISIMSFWEQAGGMSRVFHLRCGGRRKSVEALVQRGGRRVAKLYEIIEAALHGDAIAPGPPESRGDTSCGRKGHPHGDSCTASVVDFRHVPLFRLL